MNAWKAEILRIVRLATNSPESMPELVTLLILAAITFVIVLCKVGNALKFSMTDMKRSAGVLAIGLPAIILIVAAVNLYLAPHVADEDLRRWVPIVSTAVTLLAIVIPAVCLLHRAPYFQALFAILLSIAAAGAVILLVHAGFRTARGLNKEFDKTRNRTEKINELLPK